MTRTRIITIAVNYDDEDYPMADAVNNLRSAFEEHIAKHSIELDNIEEEDFV